MTERRGEEEAAVRRMRDGRDEREEEMREEVDVRGDGEVRRGEARGALMCRGLRGGITCPRGSLCWMDTIRVEPAGIGAAERRSRAVEAERGGRKCQASLHVHKPPPTASRPEQQFHRSSRLFHAGEAGRCECTQRRAEQWRGSGPVQRTGTGWVRAPSPAFSNTVTDTRSCARTHPRRLGHSGCSRLQANMEKSAEAEGSQATPGEQAS